MLSWPISIRAWLPVQLLAFALPGFAPPVHARDDIAEVRRAGRVFVDLLRRNAPPKTLLFSFAPEAFDNPVTRLIVGFTVGSASDSPGKIRSYVAEALKEISKAAAVKDANCPDRALGRQALGEQLQPNNKPSADGFALLMVSGHNLRVLEDEADPDEPQLSWLKARTADGHRMALMIVACNHVPIYLVWERQRSGKWLIIGFAVPGV